MASSKKVDAEKQSVNEDLESHRKPTPEEAQAMLRGENRQHFEGLGLQWGVLLGGMPQQLMPQVVATVLKAGGTRPAWRWNVNKTDFYLMAWPKDEPVRACVVMAGPEGDKLHPLDAFPMAEGLPNDAKVAETHPWKVGVGGNVAVTMTEGRSPMWFYDPVFERDYDMLTEGVTQTFLLSGVCLSIRKALLDDITITKGPPFEVYAQDWLEKNPGKTGLDVPPLKFNLKGRHLIMPGRQFCEYQMRATVEDVDDCRLDRMDIRILYVSFPFDDRPSLQLPLYAPKSVLKDFDPKAGDEIDAYVWLQGRVTDQDEQLNDVPETPVQ